MSQSQYDKIAKDYQKTTEEEISRLYIENPGMFRVIGKVVGLDVLGVGCGDGYFERILKQAGANQVVGTDLSDAMIDLAKQSEEEQPLGVEFIRHNLEDLPILHQFDLAVGKYVLHYAKNRLELSRMCRSVYRNLKPGGRFVALVPDHDSGVPTDPKYGFTAKVINPPLREGGTLEVTLYANDLPGVIFICRYWSKATYENALEQAGFRQIRWHKPVPSKEGIERFGQEFWQDWLDRPTSAIAEVIK